MSCVIRLYSKTSGGYFNLLIRHSLENNVSNATENVAILQPFYSARSHMLLQVRNYCSKAQNCALHTQTNIDSL